MKNKGFTLVELLTVVVIIGLIGSLVVPNIINSLNNQRKNLQSKQIEEIKKATISWGIKHLDLLPTKNSTDPIYVNISTLINENFIKGDSAVNLQNGQSLDGCMEISYDTEYKQYDYSYIDKNDDNYSNQCDNAI